jgi:hypothetical protein
MSTAREGEAEQECPQNRQMRFPANLLYGTSTRALTISSPRKYCMHDGPPRVYSMVLYEYSYITYSYCSFAFLQPSRLGALLVQRPLVRG